MAICFLFAAHLTEEGCLSLKLNDQGCMEAPLAVRTFAEIKNLQLQAKTFVILSTLHFTLHSLELPWLTERKARAAIPYALEERLAQPVEELHFAFSRIYHREGRYLVVVGDKHYLQQILASLTQNHLTVDLLTTDWFALAPSEAALVESVLLVNDPQFQGALSPELASIYLNALSTPPLTHIFPDSAPVLANNLLEKQEQSESAYIWLAQRLLAGKAINLCQGEFQQQSQQLKTKRLYQAALGLSLLWFISLIGIQSLKIHYLNQELASVETKIARIYREFFPQAQQIISPKFRIMQWLKAQQGNSEMTFWVLLNKLAQTPLPNLLLIEQIRSHNQTLLVSVSANNFTGLADFQTRLQQNQVKVKQIQASTRDKQVISTLELSL